MLSRDKVLIQLSKANFLYRGKGKTYSDEELFSLADEWVRLLGRYMDDSRFSEAFELTLLRSRFFPTVADVMDSMKERRGAREKGTLQEKRDSLAKGEYRAIPLLIGKARNKREQEK
jgi:hypothetical protein